MISNLRNNWIYTFLLLISPVFFCSVLESQALKGVIHGYVLNDEGQVIPRASVLLINKKTTLRKNAISTPQGLFQFSELAIGTYQLEVSSEGYLSEVREDIQLSLTTSIEIEIRLQKKQTSIRDAEERGAGQRHPNIFIRKVGLSPLRDPLRRRGIEPVALQFDATANNHGVDVGAPLRQIGFVRNQDTNNTFHGSLYESHQNSALNARPFFNVGKLRPSKRNQFGFNLGGPLLTERLSFTTSLDLVRESGFVNGNIRVPLPAERTPLATDSDTKNLVAALLQAYPNETPNLPNVAPRQLNTNAVRRIKSAELNLRMDYHLSSKDLLAFQYSFFDYNEKPYELVSGQNPRTEVRPQTFASNYTHIWSPQTLVQSLFQFDRVKAVLLPTEGYQQLVAPLGLSEAPGITFGGRFADLTAIGPDKQFPRRRIQNRFSGSMNLSHQRGNHQIRLGGLTTRVQVNDLQSNDRRGTFIFSSGFSRTTVQNFLSGTPIKFTKAFGDLYRGFRTWEQSLYLQDTFQIASGLTLNLGLRYEIVTAPTEVNNRIAFFYNTNNKNFGPQVGLAWAPREGRTVIRAGYGIAYGHIFPDIYQRIRYNAPAVRVIPIQAPSLSDPLKNIGSVEDQPSEVTRLSPDLSTQYSHQYNLLIQNRLPGNLLFEVGYIGNRTKGPFFPFVTNRAQVISGITSTTGNVQQRRADPTLARILTVANAGTFYYDALKIGLKRNVTEDISFNINYIFSKSLNSASNFIGTANREAGFMGAQNGKDVYADMKGPSAFDHRHIFTINYSYNLPFQTSNGFLNTLLSNWKISGETAFRSGMWFTIRTSSDGPGFGNVDGRGADRPNILDPSLLGKTIDNPDTSTSILKESAFDSNLDPGGLGDIPRAAFRADPVNNTNLSLAKSFLFPSKEHVIQLQAELYNAFNHALFATPADVYPSDVFGKIVDTQNKGRVMQITFRWSF